MLRIKRRYFLYLAGSTLSVLGLNQLPVLQQDKRYGFVVAQGATKSLRAELQKKGFNGSPISVREAAKKLGFNPPISVRQLISIKEPTTVRVRIELLDVTCGTTEDTGLFGSEDEFYIIGAVTNAKKAVQVLTPVIDIDDGQTKSIGQVIFEGDVLEGQTVGVGLKAFDEDAAKNYEEYSSTANKISSEVSGALANSGDSDADTAATIVKYLTAAVNFFISHDKDDELGTLELNVPASGPKVEEKEWKFNGDDSDYTVRYRITRTP